MLYGLMIAFVPLFLGYLFSLKSATLLNWVNRTTTLCLYLILLIMGISLGQIDDIAQKLPQIGATALGLSVIIHLCNIAALGIYDRLSPWQREAHQCRDLPSRRKQLLDSFVLLLTVASGGLIGFFSKGIVDFPLHSSTYVLVVMIFCIGIQLRHSGIPLRQVFVNRRGILTALIFMVSSWIGALISLYFFDLNLIQALTLASGFGWYSLSSVMLNDAWGPIYGSIAFFNDLSREIFCLIAIPFFMRTLPSTAIGLGGATSLDCTLPIIQKSGGIQVVPLAISFGFIINLAVPLLLALFIGLA